MAAGLYNSDIVYVIIKENVVNILMSIFMTTASDCKLLKIIAFIIFLLLFFILIIYLIKHCIKRLQKNMIVG